jgi:hypothetical protein
MKTVPSLRFKVAHAVIGLATIWVAPYVIDGVYRYLLGARSPIRLDRPNMLFFLALFFITIWGTVEIIVWISRRQRRRREE